MGVSIMTHALIENQGATKQARIFSKVIQEFERANCAEPPLHSAYEGLSMIEQEVHELRQLIHAKDRTPEARERMAEEAVQSAVLCLRFIHDVCFHYYPPPGNGNER